MADSYRVPVENGKEAGMVDWKGSSDAQAAQSDFQLHRLIEEFGKTRKPIVVSFRHMCPIRRADFRAPHDLHSYPARLLPNIPAFFLATSLSQPGDLVVDPFCGSGTVLLEAVLAGRNAAGADSNPLARLISTAKLTPVKAPTLRHLQGRFVASLASRPAGGYPDVPHLDYWFHPHVRRDLLIIREKLGRLRDKNTRALVSVAFSACLKDLSLADPRLSVPVRLRENQYPVGHWLRKKSNDRLAHLRHVDVRHVFATRLKDTCSRLAVLAKRDGLGECTGIFEDARQLTKISDGKAALVITSPPYMGAQKYIRASSLSLTWLGLSTASDLRRLDGLTIGREQYRKAAVARTGRIGLAEADLLLQDARKKNPLRAHIAWSYLSDMKDAVREIARVLKPRGHLVLVVGASSLCGVSFPTQDFLVRFAEMEGLSLRLHLIDGIRSRSLMTKRNHTAGRIDTESVLLFQKEG